MLDLMLPRIKVWRGDVQVELTATRIDRPFGREAIPTLRGAFAPVSLDPGLKVLNEAIDR